MRKVRRARIDGGVLARTPCPSIVRNSIDDVTLRVIAIESVYYS